MTMTEKRSGNLVDMKPKVKKFKRKDENAEEKKPFSKKLATDNKFSKFGRPGDKKYDKKPFDKFDRANKYGDKKFGSNKFGNNRFGDKVNKYGNKSFDKTKPWKKPLENQEQPIEGNIPAEKTDWKKMKHDKKELRLKRKQTRTKDLYELTVQAKQIYEKLKCKTTPNRDELSKELHKILGGKGNYAKLVLAHDTARVVQCMLKQAQADIKNEIAAELIPTVPQMATSKYAHFCIARMLKYGSNGMRERIINAMLGHIVKLVTHHMSTNLVDTAYLTWATNKQRIYMKQEFYGDLYKKTKDEDVKVLQDTWKNSENLKSAVMGSIKSHLEHAANKSLVDNSLIHSILVEYLGECTNEDRDEVMALFLPHIASICSTKDGAKSGCLMFWHSGNKERRSIMKTIKENVTRLCTHEHGHAFILTILTTLDDTVQMKKSLLDVILKDIEHIVSNEWGRKVSCFII